MKQQRFKRLLPVLLLAGCAGHGGSTSFEPAPQIVVEDASPFFPPESATVGDEPSDIALADFDGDGAVDLATANLASGDVTVVTNASLSPESGSSFGASVTVAAWPGSASLAASDLDADSDPDLAVLDRSAQHVRFLRNATPSDGALSFESAGNVLLASPSPWTAISADWNGDGRPDLAVSNDGHVLVLENAHIGLRARTGHFQPARVRPDLSLVAGQAMGPLNAADMDGDGKLEIVAASMTENKLFLFPNESESAGAIAFATPSVLATGSGPIDLATGDLDGDGLPEIAVANQTSQDVTIFVRQAEGGYATTTISAPGTMPLSIALGDIDGDGKLDLILGDGQSKTFLVRRNESSLGTIAFAESWEAFALGTSPTKTRVIDWNADGRIDLLSVNADVDAVTLLVRSPQ